MDTYYLQTISQYNHPRYRENGFENRLEYLKSLNEQYGKENVDLLLTVLPPEEDFDGLITELQDNY